jgi:hypothetical protein
MKKPAAAHSQLEKVGTLTKGESVITIWRKLERIVAILPDDCQYFVEENGELKPFEAFEETKNWINPIPSILEEWIEKKMEEGYKLELEVEKLNCEDLGKVIAGKTLDEWYDHFLVYYEEEDGTLMLWVWFNHWEKARTALDISRDDFADYWALLLWERDKLTSLFKEALYYVWSYSQYVVYYAARESGKYEEWRSGEFYLEDAVKYIEEESKKENVPPKGIVKRIIEKRETEPPVFKEDKVRRLLGITLKESEEWKEWLAAMVWWNIYDAAAYYKDHEGCEEHEEE